MERTVKYFSTFTGVGGFELGIQAGIPGAECVGFSEINPHSSKVLRHKFKGVKNYGDITQIKAEELPDFDILCGGFPCQAFSIAGKRMGFKDTRGTLFYELARITESKKPSILFFENVKGLLSHEEGRTLSTILKTMDELGYDAEWQLLNSKHHGVPQNRERIFIIGYIRGRSRRKIFPIRGSDTEAKGTEQGKEIVYHQKSDREISRIYDTKGIAPTLHLKTRGWQETKISVKKELKQTKDELENNKKRWGDHFKTPDEISPTLMAIGKTDVTNVVVPTQLGQSKNFGNSQKKAGEEAYTLRASQPNGVIVHSLQTRSADRPSLKKNPKAGGSGHISKVNETYCLDTGSSQAVESGTRIRKLTPKECERLQGFPDDWTKYGEEEDGSIVEISDNQRYNMMGNAVTVNVIKAIAERLHININD